MTLQEFESGLKDACPGLVFELAAPRNSQRYVAWHRYGRSSSYGDDANQIDAPKVQIDIHVKNPADPLPDTVCAVLEKMDLPYIVVSEGYDDDYADIRTILQLVVI